jgi:hypothetical protein
VESISAQEATLSDEAIKQLRSVAWAASLLAKLDPSKETREQDRSLLFEIRFAYALHRAGLTAEYEYRGLENSTLDFRVITSEYEWLIEIVSLFESDAVKGATQQVGMMQKLVLVDTPGKDNTASEAGEMIKAEEKIGEKVFSKGKPTKFPEPSSGKIHVIVTDMRGYLGIAEKVIDNDDYRQIAYGRTGVHEANVQHWQDMPIKGLFEQGNPTKATKYVRERIHILAFVCESQYIPEEISSHVVCAPNPDLFVSKDQIRAVLKQCPLRKC